MRVKIIVQNRAVSSPMDSSQNKNSIARSYQLFRNNWGDPHMLVEITILNAVANVLQYLPLMYLLNADDGVIDGRCCVGKLVKRSP